MWANRQRWVWNNKGIHITFPNDIVLITEYLGNATEMLVEQATETVSLSIKTKFLINLMASNNIFKSVQEYNYLGYNRVSRENQRVKSIYSR